MRTRFARVDVAGNVDADRPHYQTPRLITMAAKRGAAIAPSALCGMPPPAADAPAGRSCSTPSLRSPRGLRSSANPDVAGKANAAPNPWPAAEPCGSAPECRQTLAVNQASSMSPTRQLMQAAIDDADDGLPPPDQHRIMDPLCDVDPFRRTPAWLPGRKVRLAHSPHVTDRIDTVGHSRIDVVKCPRDSRGLIM